MADKRRWVTGESTDDAPPLMTTPGLKMALSTHEKSGETGLILWPSVMSKALLLSEDQTIALRNYLCLALGKPSDEDLEKDRKLGEEN
jgi:hypothetical protein